MSNRVVYLAGQWLPEAEAKVSIYDLSVMQGAAAFEMTRSFNGITFKLREHLERLKHSCQVLGIPALQTPRDMQHLTQLCMETVERNLDAMALDDEHRLLIVVSPGAAPIYHQIDGVQKESWLYIADFPLRMTVAGMGRYYDTGIAATISPIQQVPPRAIPAQAKHRSRAHFHLAQQRAAPQWAILCDEHGYVTEGPGFNLMAVRDGEVVSLGYQCLPGISQATVEELAEAAGYHVDRYAKMNLMHWKDLLQCEEVWVTGTPFCLLAIESLDGCLIGAHPQGPGPVYLQLLAAWSARVGVDIARQIQTWDLPPKVSTDMTPQALHAL